jgi:polar amino acid transport system substrate-binding protein
MKKIISAILLFAVLAVGFVALSSCEEKADTSTLKIIDVKLTDEEYAFVCDIDNKALVKDFNEFLVEIKSSGEFDSILAKYAD